MKSGRKCDCNTFVSVQTCKYVIVVLFNSCFTEEFKATVVFFFFYNCLLNALELPLKWLGKANAKASIQMTVVSYENHNLEFGLLFVGVVGHNVCTVPLTVCLLVFLFIVQKNQNWIGFFKCVIALLS